MIMRELYEDASLQRTFVIIAAAMGFLAVAAGSYAAHGLEEFLMAKGWEADEVARMLATFETGARYHMTHALALLATAWACGPFAGRCTRAAGFAFIIGMLLFSGSLYVYSTTSVSWLAHITPFGGVCLLIGWLLLLCGAICSGFGQSPPRAD